MFDRTSEVLGQLSPGQLVTVIEERIDSGTGDVRACVTIDDLLQPDGFETTRGEPSRGRALSPPRMIEEDEEVSEPSTSFNHGQSLGKSPQPSPDADHKFFGHSHGWVTLVKGGRKLVTSRVRLHAGQRRAHMSQWHRRLLNDRLSQDDVGLELDTDPTGIGFAFGGVEPGTLRSKGVLHEVHRVSYSIGIVGRYLLHVRLRQAALALYCDGNPGQAACALDAPAPRIFETDATFWHRRLRSRRRVQARPEHLR